MQAFTLPPRVYEGLLQASTEKMDFCVLFIFINLRLPFLMKFSGSCQDILRKFRGAGRLDELEVCQRTIEHLVRNT
ncbi:hypothetical protein [Psychromicrobium sp. YIM B11713]|uniref:hypothetical protein n=1 Tax=Psychromicrobium sp. YIM B11713 TaxID=3145233 RepID=UPI00374E2710